MIYIYLVYQADIIYKDIYICKNCKAGTVYLNSYELKTFT